MKNDRFSAALGTSICLLLAGCLPAQPAAPMPEARLTPFFTSTPPEAASAPAQPTETPQTEPTATPEPLIHEVALQETISSIALRYGVSMDAIIATYREGFRRRGNDVAPARTPLMIVKCVMRPAADSDRLVFGEFLRDERNEWLALGREQSWR